MGFEHVIDYGQYVYMNKRDADTLCEPRTVDSMVLLALTDGKEAWYGVAIDKKKFKIVLEDETEDSVYLKIVKKEKE